MKDQVTRLKASLEAQRAAAQRAADQQAVAGGAAVKFEVVEMSAGSTKDFYGGLEGRVGEWRRGPLGSHSLRSKGIRGLTGEPRREPSSPG